MSAAIVSGILLALAFAGVACRMERAYAAAMADERRQSAERLAEMTAWHSSVLSAPRDPLAGRFEFVRLCRELDAARCPLARRDDD